METKNWNAWVDLMPPGPPHLHVTGDVRVGNPGIEAVLTEKIPQGINPTILLLDLTLHQKPGVWPDVMTWVQARFDKSLKSSDAKYKQVEILSNGEAIANIPVKEVH